jgi:DNA-binding response OmpR family regulator
MTSKRVYKVTTAGLDVRDVRLIEIVFKHSQYNKYEFQLIGGDRLSEIDLLIANTVEAQGLDAISQLRTAKREVPVIAALPRGAVSSPRHAISIDRLTLQLLPILNRVIDIEFNPTMAAAEAASAAAQVARPTPQAASSAPTPGSNSTTIDKAAPHLASFRPEAPVPQPSTLEVSTPTMVAQPAAAQSAPPPQLASVPKSNLVAFPSALGPDGSLIERLRVLVVDDSPTVRQQLAQAFNRMGIISEVAASAKEALSRLAETTFNLALIDVVMPEMDGYKLTKEIKRNKACKQMPVIILTSKSSPFDLARGALAGCDTYLTKPVPLKELETAVVKQLRKALAIDDISGLIRISSATSNAAASQPQAQPGAQPQQAQQPQQETRPMSTSAAY